MLENKKILLIDDSKVSLLYLSGILQEKGAIVKCLNSPSETIRFLTRDNYDCILTDYEMPEISGDEVCKTIKSNPQFKHIPVILITSTSDENIITKCIQNGADNFITKDEGKTFICLKLSAAVRLKDLNQEVLQLNRINSLKNMIVTLNHEINNILTNLELEIRLHSRNFHNKESESMASLTTILNQFKNLVKRLNSISEYKEKEYSEGIQMVDID